MIQKVEISHRTIIFTVLFLLFLFFLFQIWQIIFALFISLILMASLNPLVERMEKRRLPRALAILLLYFVFFSSLVVIFGLLTPPLVKQTRELLVKTTGFLERMGFFQIDQAVISNQLGSLPQNLLKLMVSTISSILGIFIVAVITFYLLMEREKLSRYLLILFGEKYHGRIEKIFLKVETKLGEWIRAQIILSLVVGVMVYFGLLLLKIEFVLPLSLLAALLEIVPNIGPTLAAIPAVIVGLGTSPPLGLAVIALYFLVQQIENQLIVPLVMRRVVGLSPLITILALLMGFELAGVWGAFLAVPTALIIKVLLPEIFPRNRV